MVCYFSLEKWNIFIFIVCLVLFSVSVVYHLDFAKSSGCAQELSCHNQ